MTHNKAIADLFPYTSMSDARQANERAGLNWFSRDTLAWFQGRIESEVYGGGFFLSSEQQSSEHKRLYTLRRIMPDATVETIGDFQQYACKSDARKALERAASAAYLGRSFIRVTRRGFRWEVAARGWNFGEQGTLVAVESLYAGHIASPYTSADITLDARPSREQERRAVASLLQSKASSTLDFRLRDAYFERVRKTPAHSGRWLSSVYRVTA